MKTLPVTPKSRILAIDVLRGITIAGMIMVNNPGSWSSVYAPLVHVGWNGLTPTDLVFPFFMFIMGISMYITLSRTNFEFSKTYLTKLIRRTTVIFFIGIALAWLGDFLSAAFNVGSEAGFWQRVEQTLSSWKTIRIMGVMQRLALSSFFASLLVIMIPFKHILKIVGAILVGYWLILFLGNGFELSSDNIIVRVDTALLSTSHMYKAYLADGTSIPFDPEGLLSTLPCIAHVLLGVYCGRLIMTTRDMTAKISKLFIFGTIILFCGLLLSYGIPINKKIWSPTFVLVSCGLGALLLGILIWIIDIKGQKRWCVFFESFGINPLFMYVVAGVFSTLIATIRFNYNGNLISLKRYVYEFLVGIFGNNYFASLIYAFIFVGLIWTIGHQLYKRKIYIKI